MSPKDITRRVRMHNIVQWVLAITLIPISILLWWFSFWFFRLAFHMPLSLVIDNAWLISWYVAWLCMIPLVIEGLRRTRPLFDLGDYAQSDFYDNFLLQTESGYAMSWYFGHPTAMAYLVSQVMYAAPRTMVMAVASFRSLLPINDAIASDAARILGQLRASRQWTPAKDYKQYGVSLLVLDRLHLIWTEDKSGHIEIRFPAGEK